MLKLNLSMFSRQQRADPAAHQELVSAAFYHGIAQKCNGDLQHTKCSHDATGALVMPAMDETARLELTPSTKLMSVGRQHDAS